MLWNLLIKLVKLVVWLLWPHNSTSVLVVYKSGAKVRLSCTKFTVKREDGKITSIEYEAIGRLPLYLGVDNIDAVYADTFLP